MRFKTRRVAFLAAVALAVPATVAGAQALDLNHDGSPPDLAGGVVTEVQCGPNTGSVVRTNNSIRSTSSVPWAQMPFTHIDNVVVPDGPPRCIKVLFTAETSCTGFAGTDYCYVQALINGVPMDPNGANFQAIDSEDATASAHAYEWVKRVPPGVYDIEIERRVGNPATVFTHDDATIDVSTFAP
jgi:hypothetical protein